MHFDFSLTVTFARIVLASLLGAVTAGATTLTYDFTSTAAPNTYTDSAGNTPSFGNTLTYAGYQTSAGVTMKAAAWATTKTGSAFDTAYLPSYASAGYGLGVCNKSAGVSLSSCAGSFTTHQIDTVNASSGVYEYIIFQFSQPVILNGTFFTANPYYTSTTGQNTMGSDRDVTFFYGNVTNSTFSSGPTSLMDKKLTDTFFTNLTRVDIDASSIDANLDLAVTGPRVINTLIIGSRTPIGSLTAPDSVIDRWKADRLIVQTTPEPGTFALVGVALLAMGLMRRKIQPRRS